MPQDDILRLDIIGVPVAEPDSPSEVAYKALKKYLDVRAAEVDAEWEKQQDLCLPPRTHSHANNSTMNRIRSERWSNHRQTHEAARKEIDVIRRLLPLVRAGALTVAEALKQGSMVKSK